MRRMKWMLVALLFLAAPLRAQQETPCYLEGDIDAIVKPPLRLARPHRLSGLASYYSAFFDGRRTANGEIYRNARFSAAHLTLPLGCLIEVTSRATGRSLRMRVNDRGPYAKKFTIDLSRAAAEFLGLDHAVDRHVEIRIIALPLMRLPLGSGSSLTPEPQVGSVMQNRAPSPIADSTVSSPP